MEHYIALSWYDKHVNLISILFKLSSYLPIWEGQIFFSRVWSSSSITRPWPSPFSGMWLSLSWRVVVPLSGIWSPSWPFTSLCWPWPRSLGTSMRCSVCVRRRRPWPPHCSVFSFAYICSPSLSRIGWPWPLSRIGWPWPSVSFSVSSTSQRIFLNSASFKRVGSSWSWWLFQVGAVTSWPWRFSSFWPLVFPWGRLYHRVSFMFII